MKFYTKLLFLSITVTFLLLSSCGSKSKFDLAMKQAAKELNASCPAMIDEITRLDSAEVLENNSFQYNYTLVNVIEEELDSESFTDLISPQIIENVKTSPHLKSYRDNLVTLLYVYKSESGEEVAKITVGPEDYQ